MSEIISTPLDRSDMNSLAKEFEDMHAYAALDTAALLRKRDELNSWHEIPDLADREHDKINKLLGFLSFELSMRETEQV